MLKNIVLSTYTVSGTVPLSYPISISINYRMRLNEQSALICVAYYLKQSERLWPTTQK